MDDRGVIVAALENIVAAQEEERERISAELQDSTTQNLVVLGMGVAQLRRLPRLSRKSQDVLEDMANAVQALLKDLRVHGHLMSSADLDRAGLRAAAKVLVEGFGTRSGLKTSFQAVGALSALSRDIQHAAFRIIQQALSDAYRRSDRERVSVKVSHRSHILTVRVTAKGKGADGCRREHLDAPAAGVSTTGIEARVLQLGGVFDTSSEASVTVVEARIPTLSRSERA